MTRIYLGLALVLLCLLQGMVAYAEEADSPNFVFILVDDQGWTGTSVAMDKPGGSAKSDYFLTPNIERIATGGMRFSQGYAPSALCCPTRRSIQFGQMPIRHGDDEAFAKTYPVGNTRLTIPRALKALNPAYRAAHFGKWDLRTELTPEHLGYDESDGNTGNFEGSIGTRFDKEGKWDRYGVMKDPKRIYSITQRAVDFMERSVDAEQPFYLQISHYATHVDMQTTQASLDAAQSRKKGARHKTPAFAGMTNDMDKGIGKVLDTLERLEITNNTYVIYMADNGGVPWIPPNRLRNLTPPERLKEPSRNYPLRGGKWVLFEGGIRVPFMVSGPGITPGSFCDTPVVGWDLLPTFAALAGNTAELTPDLDGESFAPLLKDASLKSKRPATFIFHRFNPGYPHSAIRQGRYKLVQFWTGLDAKSRTAWTPSIVARSQLFDLEADPGETKNLAEAMPERVEALRSLLQEELNKGPIGSLTPQSLPGKGL